MLATYWVTNLLDGAVSAEGDLPGSLRQAIFDANQSPGMDTIQFSGVSGTLLLTAGAFKITGPVELSGPGRDELTLDANLQSRIFEIDDPNVSDEDFSVSLAGMTLVRGATNPSAGYHGGAISALGFIQLTVSDSSILDSTAGGGGGAIDAYGLQLVNSTISGNTADSGGGISGFHLNVTDSEISNNSAVGGGGGGVAGHTVTVSRSTISGNTAAGLGGMGGGIYAYGDVSITNSTISGNTTTGGPLIDYDLFRTADGGGVASYWGDIVVTNSTISGNRVEGEGAFGGGIAAIGGSVEIIHSTIVENVSVQGSGGGAFGDITVRNSIVANNSANFGGRELWTWFVLTVNYSLIGSTAGMSAGEINAINNGAGNLVSVDPLLGPLGDYGGATLTHALLAGSPAIDAGDPTAVAGSGGVPLYDSRGSGFSRVVDGRLDMGAFEFQAAPLGPALPGDYNLNGTVDAADYVLWRKFLGTTGVPAYEGADGDGDTEIGVGDYGVWKGHFGQVLLAATGGGAESEAFIEEELESSSRGVYGGLATVPSVDQGLAEASERRVGSFETARWRDRAFAAWLASQVAEDGRDDREAFEEFALRKEEYEQNRDLWESLETAFVSLTSEE